MTNTENSYGYTVAAAIKPDGSLYDSGWYLAWSPGNTEAVLDGKFTAAQLREIANHIDNNQ